MKKTKLTRSLLAACSIVALSAVMYGCVHNGGDDAPATDMSGTPDPVPEPTPDPGPTDLDETQAAAAAAATAAMTASTSAAASASSAAAATATLATLQTGADSNAAEMGGNEHADAASYAAKAAADAAAAAAAASAAAAAATTGEAGETAWRMAVAAQEDAEAAQALAATHSAAAIAAAMTELHINGTVKSAGDSSVDAAMGMLTVTALDGSKTITGHQSDLMREMSGAVVGRAHSAPAATTVVPYRQAVEARDLAIGKTLDTTDDKARLTVIHSRAGTKKVSVYADGDLRVAGGDTIPDVIIRTNSDGLTIHTVEGTPPAADAVTNQTTTDATPALKSVGMYMRATESEEDNASGVGDYSYVDPMIDGVDALAAVPDTLDPTDLVQALTKSKEVFSYLNLGPGNEVGGIDAEADTTRYVVESNRIVNAVTGDITVTYQHVDTMAPAAPDTAADNDLALDLRGVKASIPMAIPYDHIHFGVWAALGAAAKTGAQKLDGLGIGFVQSIGDGETARLGIGTAIYSGDWVAVVQRQNSAAKGAYNMYDGAATLTADFDEDEFTAALAGLATLTGDLSGNGFSGTKATAISHADLDSNGTFAGEFSGGIYGAKGEEAAGVFDFAGGEAGSFVGAFGGTNQD